MGIRVLVCADRPREKLHSCCLFILSHIHVGQNPSLGFECFLHENAADTSIREAGGFPDENFDALHGLKYGDIEVTTDECTPHLVRNPGMENLFWENSRNSGVCKFRFIFVLMCPSTQDAETVLTIPVRARDEHPLRLQPCPSLTNGDLYLFFVFLDRPKIGYAVSSYCHAVQEIAKMHRLVAFLDPSTQHKQQLRAEFLRFQGQKLFSIWYSFREFPHCSSFFQRRLRISVILSRGFGKSRPALGVAPGTWFSVSRD